MSDYTESIIHLLDTKKSNIDYTKKRDIFICMYSVMEHDEKPYVCYLTHVNSVVLKGKNKKIATFPHVFGNQSVSETKKEIDKLTTSMIYHKNKYVGSTLYNENYYLFFEVYGLETPLSDDKDNNLYWTSMHELVNIQHILGVPIHNTVSNLFLKHNGFIYFSENAIPIEINLSVSNKTSFLHDFQKYDADKNMFVIKHSDTVSGEYIRALLFRGDGDILFEEGNIYYKEKDNLIILSISQM